LYTKEYVKRTTPRVQAILQLSCNLMKTLTFHTKLVYNTRHSLSIGLRGMSQLNHIKKIMSFIEKSESTILFRASVN